MKTEVALALWALSACGGEAGSIADPEAGSECRVRPFVMSELEDWALQGNAALAGSEIVLTEHRPNQISLAVEQRESLHFTHPWTVSFDYHLDLLASGRGADGMTFFLVDAAWAQLGGFGGFDPEGGGLLGWHPNVDTAVFIVEIDLFTNVDLNDPPAQHVSMYGTGEWASPLATAVLDPQLESGVHPVVVSRVDDTVCIELDGRGALCWPFTPDQLDIEMLPGFTGTTGELTAMQAVSEIQIRGCTDNFE
jgi:hypothetical protein